MQQCRRSWEEKLKCVKIQSVKPQGPQLLQNLPNMNYLPTCKLRLVVQHTSQVSFKSMQQCRRNWEDKLKCVKILRFMGHNSCKIWWTYFWHHLLICTLTPGPGDGSGDEAQLYHRYGGASEDAVRRRIASPSGHQRPGEKSAADNRSDRRYTGSEGKDTVRRRIATSSGHQRSGEKSAADNGSDKRYTGSEGKATIWRQIASSSGHIRRRIATSPGHIRRRIASSSGHQWQGDKSAADNGSDRRYTGSEGKVTIWRRIATSPGHQRPGEKSTADNGSDRRYTGSEGKATIWRRIATSPGHQQQGDKSAADNRADRRYTGSEGKVTIWRRIASSSGHGTETNRYITRSPATGRKVNSR